jgi:hypothetical protein
LLSRLTAGVGGGPRLTRPWQLEQQSWRMLVDIPLDQIAQLLNDALDLTFLDSNGRYVIVSLLVVKGLKRRCSCKLDEAPTQRQDWSPIIIWRGKSQSAP